MPLRQPAFYLSHGGGPSFWIDYPPPIGPRAFAGLKAFLESLPASLPERPRAWLVISAHWEADKPTVSTAEKPGMLYDYYGFPPIAYQLQHPAPGAPDLAARIQTLLGDAGLETATDAERGYDHGVFVPMKIIDPNAEIPIVMLSLRGDLDPAFHLAVGKALEPLRDEGVVILGSGSSFHDLRDYFTGRPSAKADAFDAWLTETATLPDVDARNERLTHWADAPGARAAHPREEHLLPLMVAAGAAGKDAGRKVYTDVVANKPFSAYAFG